jgi:hypothetical protein
LHVTHSTPTATDISDENISLPSRLKTIESNTANHHLQMSGSRDVTGTVGLLV